MIALVAWNYISFVDLRFVNSGLLAVCRWVRHVPVDGGLESAFWGVYIWNRGQLRFAR